MSIYSNCLSHAYHRQLEVTAGFATLYSGSGMVNSVHMWYWYLHIKIMFMIISWLRLCFRDGLNSMGWTNTFSLLVDSSWLDNSLAACANITDQEVGLLMTQLNLPQHVRRVTGKINKLTLWTQLVITSWWSLVSGTILIWNCSKKLTLVRKGLDGDNDVATLKLCWLYVYVEFSCI